MIAQGLLFRVWFAFFDTKPFSNCLSPLLFSSLPFSSPFLFCLCLLPFSSLSFSSAFLICIVFSSCGFFTAGPSIGLRAVCPSHSRCHASGRRWGQAIPRAFDMEGERTDTASAELCCEAAFENMVLTLLLLIPPGPDHADRAGAARR